MGLEFGLEEIGRWSVGMDVSVNCETQIEEVNNIIIHMLTENRKR